MDNNSSARSWNDPPVMKFDSTVPVNSKQHLKKRVSSSLDKQKEICLGASNDLDNAVIKPLSTVVIPNTPPSDDKETILLEADVQGEQRENHNVNISEEEMLQFVTSTFKNVLLESSGSSEKTLKEIDRRITLMEKSWNSNLSKEVKHMMYKLAQELNIGDTEAALKIHCSLMVQNVREVKNWMVGVKHIIEMKKNNQILSSSDLATKE